MTTIANIAVALVAILHFFFLVLEMFLWTKPLGLRTFGTTPEGLGPEKHLEDQEEEMQDCHQCDRDVFDGCHGTPFSPEKTRPYLATPRVASRSCDRATRGRRRAMQRRT